MANMLPEKMQPSFALRYFAGFESHCDIILKMMSRLCVPSRSLLHVNYY